MNDRNDEFHYKFELLKQEIDELQAAIRSYDALTFVIRGWATTFFSAFIVFIIDKREASFFLTCLLAITLFWLIDAVYRGLQREYINRTKKIEEFLNDSPAFNKAISTGDFGSFQVPNLAGSFKEKTRWEIVEGLVKEVRLLHNSVLYLSMFVIVAVIGMLMITGVI
ncbi:MAG TPA: hypothetical protein VF707_07855 [Ardenticatenaceae bacterium]|jgi:hypothetical protein